MLHREASVAPEEGLHARPATIFVKEAKRYGAEISISKGGEPVNAKSSLGVMSLGARRGDRISIRAEGEDERSAVEALVRLIEEEA